MTEPNPSGKRYRKLTTKEILVVGDYLRGQWPRIQSEKPTYPQEAAACTAATGIAVGHVHLSGVVEGLGYIWPNRNGSTRAKSAKAADRDAAMRQLAAWLHDLYEATGELPPDGLADMAGIPGGD